MSPFQSWLHIFLIVACVVGVFFVLKSKLSQFLKTIGSVVLIALAIMLIVEIFVKIWQFQLARGF